MEMAEVWKDTNNGKRARILVYEKKSDGKDNYFQVKILYVRNLKFDHLFNICKNNQNIFTTELIGLAYMEKNINSPEYSSYLTYDEFMVERKKFRGNCQKANFRIFCTVRV